MCMFVMRCLDTHAAGFVPFAAVNCGPPLLSCITTHVQFVWALVPRHTHTHTHTHTRTHTHTQSHSHTHTHAHSVESNTGYLWSISSLREREREREGEGKREKAFYGHTHHTLGTILLSLSPLSLKVMEF
jgi:hypothetical protein